MTTEVERPSCSGVVSGVRADAIDEPTGAGPLLDAVRLRRRRALGSFRRVWLAAAERGYWASGVGDQSPVEAFKLTTVAIKAAGRGAAPCPAPDGRFPQFNLSCAG
jgi:hypothetical protein